MRHRSSLRRRLGGAKQLKIGHLTKRNQGMCQWAAKLFCWVARRFGCLLVISEQCTVHHPLGSSWSCSNWTRTKGTVRHFRDLALLNHQTAPVQWHSQFVRRIFHLNFRSAAMGVRIDTISLGDGEFPDRFTATFFSSAFITQQPIDSAWNGSSKVFWV